MKKIQADDLLKFRHLGALSANDEKNRALFLASQANEKDNAYHHTLYELFNGRIKKHVALKKESGVTWLSDDTVLIPRVANKRDEALKKANKHVYYAYNLTEQTWHEKHVFNVKPSFVGRFEQTLILTLKLPEKATGLLSDKTFKSTQANLKKERLYEVIDQMPYYYNGPGFITGVKTILATYDLSTKTLTPITSMDESVSQVTLDQNNQTIYYASQPLAGLRPMTSNIYAYEFSKSMTVPVDTSMRLSVKELIVLNDTLVVVASEMDRFGLNQNPDFYVYTRHLEKRATFGLSWSNTVGTDVRYLNSPKHCVMDDTLYFVMTNDDHCEIHMFDSSGTITPYYVADGAIDGLIAMDGELYMIAMLGQSLQEVYRLNDGKVTPLTRLNTHVFKEKQPAVPMPLEIDKTTHTVKGFVLDNAHNEKKKPLILDIHGGPKTVYGSIYYHEMQVWADQGYLVAFANPRGSDGKGNEFADIRGKYGTIDYEDLMDFLDAVIDKYPVDESHIFVTGGSYGGFMTNWMVGQTNRFKAAVTQRSISNWISFYGTSDIGYFFAADQTDGHPLKDFDKLWEQSPLKYALNIQTPLLFIHSDKDYRCPIEQAQQLHAVLMNEGVDTELIWFKDETHELSRSGKPAARLKRLFHITEWFERYA